MGEGALSSKNTGHIRYGNFDIITVMIIGYMYILYIYIYTHKTFFFSPQYVLFFDTRCRHILLSASSKSVGLMFDQKFGLSY